MNEFGSGRREAEQRGVHEGVVDDHIGARKEFRAAQGEQAGVTGTGADEINFSRNFHARRLRGENR
jgi:hypothetical protein